MRRVWRTLPQKRAARPAIFGQWRQQRNNRIGPNIKDRLPRNRRRSPTGRLPFLVSGGEARAGGLKTSGRRCPVAGCGCKGVSRVLGCAAMPCDVPHGLRAQAGFAHSCARCQALPKPLRLQPRTKNGFFAPRQGQSARQTGLAWPQPNHACDILTQMEHGVCPFSSPFPIRYNI